MPRVILAVALPLALIADAGAQTISALAWDQTFYPTLPSGATLLLIQPQGPALAPDGAAAFLANFAGSSTGAVVCASSPAGPLILVHEGDPAPGAGGLNFGAPLQVIGLAGGEAISIQLTTGGGAAAGTALYLSDSSGLHPLMLPGQAAPGAPGFTFFQPANLVSAQGSGAFSASLQPMGGTSGGLWSGAPGNLGLLARLGDQAPGFAAGRPYILLTSFPALNASGVALFSATIGPVATQDLAVYSGTPGSLSRIYATGQPAPGIPNGVFCLGSGVPATPALNAAGDAVFGASVCDGISTRRSLWLASGSTLTPIMVQGDPAPDTTDTFFGNLGVGGANTTPVVTETRRVAFIANLTGPTVTTANDTAIYAGTPGNLRLISRTGNSAPGFPAGTTIRSFTASGSPASIFAINSRDQIVFPALVSDGGPQIAALYYADPFGHITLLLYSGGPINVSPGTGGTLSQFYLVPAVSNAPSGRASFLDDAGRVAMQVRVSVPAGGLRTAAAILQLPEPCYANCDLSTAPPILNVIDFSCFLNRFAAGDSYANCDGSTTPPVLNVLDFTCFLNAFAAGCP